MAITGQVLTFVVCLMGGAAVGLILGDLSSPILGAEAGYVATIYIGPIVGLFVGLVVAVRITSREADRREARLRDREE